MPRMAPLDLDLDLALETARRAAEAAGCAALAHFRAGVAVERKPDRSPVTAADRDAEAAILEIVRAAFPAASILAEETGAHAGDPSLRWIVDPLDGTRGFTRGGSVWGPLIALEHNGEIVAGAAALPAAGELYFAARGRGCHRGDGAPVRLSGIDDWAEATISVGELLRRRRRRAHGARRPRRGVAGGGRPHLGHRAHEDPLRGSGRPLHRSGRRADGGQRPRARLERPPARLRARDAQRGMKVAARA